ncbi:MAG: hypothetical protein ABJC89_22045, partial [Acidobacteriota bacterium]
MSTVVTSDDGPGGDPGDRRRTASSWLVWLQRIVVVEPRELTAVLWSWVFFFSVLTSYYVLRP